MKLGVVLFTIYFAIVAAIVASLLVVRQKALDTMSTPQAQAEWDRWREAAAKETGEDTPVKRSAPSTTQPPLLVLMRDHFAAALFGLLAPASALYWFFAWIAVGVYKQSGQENPRS